MVSTSDFESGDPSSSLILLPVDWNMCSFDIFFYKIKKK